MASDRLGQVAAQHERSVEALARELERGRATLAAVRSQRIQPERDAKAMAAWNALAVTGLLTASRAFDEHSLLAAAVRCADFVWEHMRVDGRLQRAWRDGRASGPGFLDDHALLGLAMLGLFETTGDIQWFERAGELSRTPSFACS